MIQEWDLFLRGEGTQCNLSSLARWYIDACTPITCKYREANSPVQHSMCVRMCARVDCLSFIRGKADSLPPSCSMSGAGLEGQSHMWFIQQPHPPTIPSTQLLRISSPIHFTAHTHTYTLTEAEREKKDNESESGKMKTRNGMYRWIYRLHPSVFVSVFMSCACF